MKLTARIFGTRLFAKRPYIRRGAINPRDVVLYVPWPGRQELMVMLHR